MAALVLACKQVWGHIQTCATVVKMADLKYYSFKFSFSKFFFLFFFLLYVKHEKWKWKILSSRLVGWAIFFSRFQIDSVRFAGKKWFGINLLALKQFNRNHMNIGVCGSYFYKCSHRLQRSTDKSRLRINPSETVIHGISLIGRRS